MSFRRSLLKLTLQRVLLKIISSIPSDSKLAPTAEEDNLKKLKAVYTSCMDAVSHSPHKPNSAELIGTPQ
jgi:hypothetical protein